MILLAARGCSAGSSHICPSRCVLYKLFLHFIFNINQWILYHYNIGTLWGIFQIICIFKTLFSMFCLLGEVGI